MSTALGQLLPQRIDNVYRGHPLAPWILMPIVAMKTAIALGTILNGRTVAQTADGVPLDTFGAEGAQAVVALFGLWGLSQLLFGMLGVMALTRYRAMIPALFLLLLLEHLGRRLILMVHPIAKTGTPFNFYINLVFLVLMIIGLILSLQRRAEPASHRDGS